ncbi:MAG: cytochrome b/b6 domain-containing protein [Gammaproteobacteria bacterium]|nr:cytochrome b/b6 domain-containing protein [Gammaproteobacteria bacterium]
MTDGTAMIKVWDPLVRIGHWSLVALFAIAYLSGDEDSDLHIYAGYALLAIVLLRIVWGLVGSQHARFSDFIKGPVATLSYLRAFMRRQPPHYLGHNPLGGWMVIALLTMLLLVSWSGLKAYAAEGHGPLAQHIELIGSAHADDDGGGNGAEDEFWEEAHELLSNLTLLLIGLHVAGVIASSIIHRESLVKAMITGNKRRDDR